MDGFVALMIIGSDLLEMAAGALYHQKAAVSSDRIKSSFDELFSQRVFTATLMLVSVFTLSSPFALTATYTFC